MVYVGKKFEVRSLIDESQRIESCLPTSFNLNKQKSENR